MLLLLTGQINSTKIEGWIEKMIPINKSNNPDY